MLLENLKSGLQRLQDKFGGEEKAEGPVVGERVVAENFVWIFGTGRSGSSWISRMLRDLRGYTLWNEPLVGHMLGHLYHERGSEIHHLDNFLLGGDEALWLPPVREFILAAASAKFPQNVGEPGRYLVVKEPHGSIGADIISRAFPESRMVVLLRDPRDVTASKLDAARPGSWAKKGDLYEKLGGDETKYVNSRAYGYVRDLDYARRAYEAHPGPKATIRYEDVRAEPEIHLEKLLRELGLRYRKEDIARVVEKHDWSNVPREQRGSGKILRKARPGGYREDLTEEQIHLIEKATAHYLDEFYPDFPRG
ncbi:MAG: sulfotransferase family protein [Rubrobacter sp.]